jgi:squamous cell carcinoma antigen recognized by T-cells 3
LEVFTDKHEAIVEFQLASDAARFLLLPDPFEFNGVRLRFSEGEETPVKARNASTAASGLFIPRNAASRPRAGLGRTRNPPPAVAAAGTSSDPEANAQTSSGDKALIQGKAQDDFRKMLLGGK